MAATVHTRAGSLNANSPSSQSNIVATLAVHRKPTESPMRRKLSSCRRVSWLVVASLAFNIAWSINASETSPEAKSMTIRVAAVSFVPTKLDLAGNANRMEQAFREAQKGGAKIAVGPEGALDGYVVNEIIAGEFATERMKEVAIPIHHTVIRRFQGLAAKLDMCLVFGFAELVGADIFNSAVFIDNKGEISGKYHKMQFAEGYDPSWWFNRLGQKSRAFDTPYGRCGIMICNDRWNPTLARIPALDGAQFFVIPSFGSRSKKQDEAVLSRGCENDLPVIEANVGVTLIVDQQKIAAVDRHEEGITFANITIPPAISAQPEERDEVERKFLKWREEEMQRRLQRRLKRIRETGK